MTTHGIRKNLSTLIGNAEAIGYTIPEPLSQAWSTYTLLNELQVPRVSTPSLQMQAHKLLDDASAGRPLNLLDYGRAFITTAEDARAEGEARRVLETAIDSALMAAANRAGDLVEVITTEHLRPIWAKAMTEASKAVEDIAGHSLEPATLLQAPTKVRTAYLKLPEIDGRIRGLMAARRAAEDLGFRKPEHDTSGLFAQFRKPLALVPNYNPMTPIRELPFPQDPAERMVWRVRSIDAEPWFPTIAERDHAWLSSPLGQAAEAFAVGTRNARNVAAQAR